jgi:drug/metabolite transporter (DMT)-like permease
MTTPLPSGTPEEWKGYLMVAGAAMFWGVSGVLVKYVFLTRDLDPLTLVQFRMTLTCLIVGLGLAVTRPSLLRVRVADLPFLGFYGVFGLAATQTTYYLSIRESSIAVAVFLQFLAPLLTAVYETRVLRRRPGKATFAVLATAVAGTLLLMRGQGDGMATTPAGLVLGLASAFALAAYSLTARHGLRRYGPWTLLFWGMAAGSLLWAVVRPPWVVLARPWTWDDWGIFLFLAVFSGAIPFGLFLSGLRHIGATSAILTATLEPVWASFLAAVFLGQSLAPPQVAGCLVILGAIVALRTVPGAAIAEPRPAGGEAGGPSASPGPDPAGPGGRDT